MNKKNIILILIGIFLISLRFNVTFGHINIDITNDCVGFLLIVLGAIHMMHRNSLFKKAGIVSIAGLIASIAAQVINFINWQDAAGTMLSISMGINIILTILQKLSLWRQISRKSLLPHVTSRWHGLFFLQPYLYTLWHLELLLHYIQYLLKR